MKGELLFYELAAAAAIEQLAKRHGISVQTVREEIQTALDAAWDGEHGAALRNLFPGGKPTAEEFIGAAAKSIEPD